MCDSVSELPCVIYIDGFHGQIASLCFKKIHTREHVSCLCSQVNQCGLKKLYRASERVVR